MIETTRTPVFSRYEVLEKIGSGGMGTVYKARDLHLDRWVALKVLPPGMQDDEEALERFKREARALARLKHPRVAAVYDAHVEGGFPHLVMEYVEGEDLEQRLRHTGPLPVPDVVRLGIEVAEALDHIHAQGLVHRDVKTANLIVGPEGRAVLTDFGIAFEPSLPRISQGSMGTPEYMSPEQAAGQVLDGRSDLYSLGVVLYECLTGQLPFQRSGEGLAALTALLTDVMERPAPPLAERRPDAPAWLAAVVARCLAKEASARYATGAELALALRLGEGTPAPAPTPPAAPPAVPGRPPAPGRAPKLLAAGGRRGITLISHICPVDAVAFSPDSSRLASASEDGLVRVWQVADGRLLHTLEGHTGNVVSVAFSPDGRHLASGDVTGGVCLWDAGDGALVRRLDGHSALVMAVAFSPDGRFLATGGADRAVRIWNHRRGSLERTAGWHDGYVLSVAFSPDGQRLASGGADGEVRVWDAKKGKLVRALEGDGAWVMSVAFSPDGQHLASAGADQAVHVWRAATGEHLRRLDGHGAWVMSVAFSPGGDHLVSAGRDHMMHVWDLPTGRLLRRLDGHTGPVTAAVFSPDGHHLASASSDQTVRLWPLHARTFRRRWPVWHLAVWLLLAALTVGTFWAERPAWTSGTTFLKSAAAAVAAFWTGLGEDEPTPAAQRPRAAGERARPDASASREAGAAPAARQPAARPAPRRVVHPPLYSREAIVPARGGWTLIVSTGGSRQRADDVAAGYRKRGFRTGIFTRRTDDGHQYLVGVGQYERRADASRARFRLAGRELPFSTWIMDVE